MTVHFQRQTDRLKKMILALGTLVEEHFQSAIRAVQTRDAALAKRVIDGDTQIDLMEIDVEEECLHTLALYQPVAFDLRFVVAVLKINSDLERIADLSVNIAEQASFLMHHERMADWPFDVPGMAQKVAVMLKRSLDALVNVDPQLAQAVRETDDEVDAIHRQTYVLIEQRIRESPEKVEQLVNLLNLSRQLERIADHCVNIAEDVIYMAQGEILRHRRKHTIPKEPASTP